MIPATFNVKKFASAVCGFTSVDPEPTFVERVSAFLTTPTVIREDIVEREAAIREWKRQILEDVNGIAVLAESIATCSGDIAMAEAEIVRLRAKLSQAVGRFSNTSTTKSLGGNNASSHV